jgi:hypothetical protein
VGRRVGVATKTEMQARLEVRDKTYKEKWKARRKGEHDKPRYSRHPDPHHLPVIVTEGEWVRFECEHPFLVVVLPETDVEQTENGPSSPFVGTDPSFPFSESSKPDGDRHFVKRKVSSDSLSQLFYKMLFIVLDKHNKKPELVDPDFFCDR